MKTKAKLCLLSLGAALTCGVISASLLNHDKTIETKAEATQYWVRASSIDEFYNQAEATRILLGTDDGSSVAILRSVNSSSPCYCEIKYYPLQQSGNTKYFQADSSYLDALDIKAVNLANISSSWGSLSNYFGLQANLSDGAYYLNRGSNGTACINGVEVTGAEVNVPQFKMPGTSGFKYSVYFGHTLNAEGYVVESNNNRILTLSDDDKLYFIPNSTSKSISVYYQTTAFNLNLNLPNGDMQTVPVFNGKPLLDVDYPHMEGYVFKGYYDCQKGGKKYFDEYGHAVVPSLTLTNDLNLYPQYYRNIDKNALVHSNDDYKSLQEDIITFSNTGVTGSNQVGHANVSSTSDLILNNPTNVIYTFTGSNEGRNGGWRIAKPSDDEYTYYIRLKNWVFFNNSWGGGPSFGNDYLRTDGTIGASTKPIHYVFILEGNNIAGGHNQTGVSFEINTINDPLKTIQFTTEVGGSFAAAVTYPNCANAIPFRINEPDEQLIPFNQNTKLASVQVGKASGNLNTPNKTSLTSRVNGVNYTNYDPTFDGLVQAIRDNYPNEAGGYNVSIFRYDTFRFTLEFKHNYEYVAGIPATCSSTGIKEHYTCECGKNYILNEEGIYVEVSSDSLIIPVDPHAHNFESMTLVEAVDSTCEESGNIKYYVCSECDALLVIDEDTGYINEVSEEDIIVPINHEHHLFSDLSHFEKIPETCTTEGNIEYYVCPGCDSFLVIDEDTGYFKEVSEEDIIVPINHEHHHFSDLSHVEKIPETCTTEGNIEYYVCPGCGAILVADGDNYREITLEETITPAYGHNYVANVTKMATTEEEGIITYTCSNCGDVYTESIPKLPTPPKEEDLTPEEYAEQQKAYEKAQEQAVQTMVEVLPDVITVPEEPSQDQFDTEEEYQEQLQKYEEKQENQQKLNEALSKITEVNTTDTSSEEATVSKEAKQKAQENVVQITDTVTSEMNSLDNDKADLQQELEELLVSFDPITATDEEKRAVEAKKEEIKVVETKKEIVEVVTTQAVVVTAKQTESKAIAEEANLNDIPADVGLGDMGDLFNDFMQKQINDLLGIKPVGPARRAGAKRAGEQTSQGIDFEVGDNLDKTKQIYQQVEEFVDQTVEETTIMAKKIRTCSGTVSKSEIKVFINKITSESFRDFDKEKADADFAEAAYQAVLRNMQSQVLASLEASKPSGNYEQLQNWQEEYDAVTDMESFEIMVTEVMRVKYNTLTTNPIDDVDVFYPIFRQIFENWALDKEDNSGITLEQLTTATVEETRKRVGPAIVHSELETKETVTIVVVIAAAALIIASFAIIPTVILNKKRRRGGAK